MPVCEVAPLESIPISEQRNPTVLLGSAALPYAVQIAGTVDMTHKYVFEGVKADGLEVIAARNVFMWQILRRANVVGEAPISTGTKEQSDFDRKVQELIQAWHSSFNKGANEARSRSIQGLVSRLRGWFFPSWDESLDRAEKVQPLLGRKLSVVVYGEDGYSDDYSDYTQFEERSMQPKRSVWNKWGRQENSPTEKIAEDMDDHGAKTFTWDTAHAEEFDDPSALLRRLLQAGLVRRFHLSVGRKDQKEHMKELGKEGFGKQTEMARKAFIDSPVAALETPEGQQLRLYLKYMEAQGLPAIIVLEEKPQIFVGKAREEQRRIVANIRLLAERVAIDNLPY